MSACTAAVGATAFGASLAITPQPPDTVLYVVSSDSPITAISWRDSLGNMREQPIDGVRNSWTWTFTTDVTDPPYFVSARSTGAAVSCRLMINGKLKVEDNTAHPDSTATCHG
ncbi:MAG: MmpS family transport accessory protein [Mycobacterium sp.]